MHLLQIEDLLGQVADLGHLIRLHAGKINCLHFLVSELAAIYSCVPGHQNAVSVNGHVKAGGDQRQSPRGLIETHVVNVESHGRGLDTIVHCGVDAEGLEYLLDDLLLASAEMETMQSRGRRDRRRVSDGARCQLVERSWLFVGSIVAELVEVLICLNAFWVKFNGLSQCGACRSRNPVAGCANGGYRR